ncbi:MAG: Arabinose import ATP-binding protein AraG [Rhodocyclaceae bacterium]|nr:Arabinose import ATP-binding protein AraG [Rhodocyclaceae bacterium]
MTALLEATGLGHRFGGVSALHDVGITLRRGEVHAVIGPNGAGKTTLLNLLTGVLVPRSGSILLRGRDIAGRTAVDIARLGVARTFQHSQVFMEASVRENLRLAAQRGERDALSPWRGPGGRGVQAGSSRAAQRVAAVLEQMNLADQADEAAANLSHGGRRLLEIGMCLAVSAEVLLLDEPLAGLDAQEAERMIRRVDMLAADHAIMLIEHDMDAVFRLAARITVLAEGRVIACGDGETIRRHPAVQRAYLGVHHG